MIFSDIIYDKKKVQLIQISFFNLKFYNFKDLKIIFNLPLI